MTTNPPTRSRQSLRWERARTKEYTRLKKREAAGLPRGEPSAAWKKVKAEMDASSAEMKAAEKVRKAELKAKIKRWKQLIQEAKRPNKSKLGAMCGLTEIEMAYEEERYEDAYRLEQEEKEHEREGRPMSLTAADGTTEVVRQVYGSRREARQMAEQYPGTEFIANYSKSDGNRVRIRYWVGKYGIMQSADAI